VNSISNTKDLGSVFQNFQAGNARQKKYGKKGKMQRRQSVVTGRSNSKKVSGDSPRSSCKEQLVEVSVFLFLKAERIIEEKMGSNEFG
jgi:hypothetical protein